MQATATQHAPGYVWWSATYWARCQDLTLMISSYVSSSISTVVCVSSTSPKIMFKC